MPIGSQRKSKRGSLLLSTNGSGCINKLRHPNWKFRIKNVKNSTCLSHYSGRKRTPVAILSSASQATCYHLPTQNVPLLAAIIDCHTFLWDSVTNPTWCWNLVTVWPDYIGIKEHCGMVSEELSSAKTAPCPQWCYDSDGQLTFPVTW